MESAASEVVRGRKDQRLIQLPGPAPGNAPQEQDSHSLGRRTGRPAADLLPGTAPPGLPLRKCAEGSRPQGRRPRHHLHGHGAGTAGGAARVRSPGRDSQRGVRRIFVRSTEGEDSGPGGAGGDYGRRILAPRQRGPAQGSGGYGAGGLPHRAERNCLPQDGRRGADGGGPRSLVARTGRRRQRGVPGRTTGERTSALRAVHVGHYGQTERHRPHHGGLSASNHDDDEVGLRPAGRRHLLVYGGHRLGDRPQLHRLRTAFGGRHQHDV